MVGAWCLGDGVQFERIGIGFQQLILFRRAGDASTRTFPGASLIPKGATTDTTPEGGGCHGILLDEGIVSGQCLSSIPIHN
jgi:hypothetical protein